MTDPCHLEEHELPPLEALLACTFALMTGYGQALQAELHPRQRLAMGDGITTHLATLVGQPQLSVGFRQVLASLQSRWQAMADCTRDAAAACADSGSCATCHGPDASRPPTRTRWH